MPIETGIASEPSVTTTKPIGSPAVPAASAGAADPTAVHRMATPTPSRTHLVWARATVSEALTHRQTWQPTAPTTPRAINRPQRSGGLPGVKGGASNIAARSAAPQTANGTGAQRGTGRPVGKTSRKPTTLATSRNIPRRAGTKSSG